MYQYVACFELPEKNSFHISDRGTQADCDTLRSLLPKHLMKFANQIIPGIIKGRVIGD